MPGGTAYQRLYLGIGGGVIATTPGGTMARPTIDYGVGYNQPQAMTDMGAEVPGAAATDRGSVRDVIGPDTEAGQALLVAAIGFGVVVAAMPAGKLHRRAGMALQTIAFVAGSVVVFNYLARVFVARHPDAPLAMGVHFDA